MRKTRSSRKLRSGPYEKKADDGFDDKVDRSGILEKISDGIQPKKREFTGL
jgi:hypothetical protein